MKKDITPHGLPQHRFPVDPWRLVEREYDDSDLGLTETGLTQVIRAGYDLLHLITFFTAGPKEARAWTVEKGAKAPQAAIIKPPAGAHQPPPTYTAASLGRPRESAMVSAPARSVP